MVEKESSSTGDPSQNFAQAKSTSGSPMPDVLIPEKHSSLPNSDFHIFAGDAQDLAHLWGHGRAPSVGERGSEACTRGHLTRDHIDGLLLELEVREC